MTNDEFSIPRGIVIDYLHEIRKMLTEVYEKESLTKKQQQQIFKVIEYCGTLLEEIHPNEKGEY
ncbi:MAG: hypothetical protein FWC41_04935 [Firmicutes bacterium]|nr:hypothetical protein [Bacillota bacterium]